RDHLRPAEHRRPVLPRGRGGDRPPRRSHEGRSMSEKRRGLGRGLGALIPDSTTAGRPVTERPVDVWFKDQDRAGVPNTAAGMLADSIGDVGRAVSDPAGTAGPETSPPAAEGSETAMPDETDLAPVPGAVYGEVPVGAIRPNPRQPRTVF